MSILPRPTLSLPVDRSRRQVASLELFSRLLRYHCSFRLSIGRGLNVPVISISQEQAQEHFGFLGFFAGRDPLTSSAQTRAKLGWNPTGPSLLTDLGNMRYSEV
jgi:hypothetical protein